MTDVSVGTVLWYRSIDYRDGRDEESKWQAFEVVKEGREFWHVQRLTGSKAYRIRKDDLRGEMRGKGYGDHQLFTAAGKEDQIWRNKHARHVTDLLGRCDDVEVLKRIAEILGYKAD